MDHSEIKHLPKVDHTPAELDEASELLMKAAAIIERGGLCKHAYEDGDAHCIYGAMRIAAGLGLDVPKDGGTVTPVLVAANERLERAVGNHVSLWNDAPRRTKDEVVAKLRAVALGL